MIKKQVQEIIISTTREIGKEDNKPGLINADKSTRLYGQDGPLDSLGLVRLISEIEEKLYEAFHKDIAIANEKAMSRKSSPFLNISTLTDFITELMSEEENG